MVHRIGVLLTALLTATVLVGGCASGSPQSTGDRLNFNATTLDGQPFSGESLAGKPAVLWFWAPWCPACQGEAPAVAKVAAANPLVTFVGVGARDELAAMQAFATKYGIDAFTELADTDATIWAKFGVTRQPAYAFLSPGGDVEVVKGSLPEDELSTRVAALAQQ
ncbi:redoxin family protein [Mycolicibacter arupensis]|jgi:thiol-disulfide isomerase/thioredoxin|uniref:Soluble secreted antigen MPT53 n=1 Tax=Mycolicibacter arupensis TaxID=342002 RepID=A0A5C7Y7U9_9MYCO|nr:redoxin family protein [Mycolicibacter arupensis]TXI57999.1 MAG: redoxin domain-containing protein [Mycolicibacter arupensis]